MGDYNWYRPQILGEEWVPIRDENLELSPATNFVEAGHEFTLTTSRTLANGRYYVNTIRPASDSAQHLGIAIYPAGTEDQSGPIHSVIIPVNSASVTGGSVVSAANAAAALLSPTDGSIFFDADSATSMGVRIGFAVNQYPVLNGKRILGVNLLHTITGSDELVGPGVDGATQLTLSTEFSATPSVNFVLYDRLHSSIAHDIVRVPLGEINPFWTSTSPVSTPDRMHWTYAQLLRLDTTTPWLFVTMSTGTGINNGAPVGTFMTVQYVALEVLYCEEKRISFGAIQLGNTGGVAIGKDSIYGANIVTMRSMAYAASPSLAAGTYTAVVTSPFVGTQGAGVTAASNYPFLNAERELYAIPPHPGVQVNIPFPMDDTAVGKVLTRQQIHVLPQLSIHASGGTLTEPHVYGRQGAAQVYGVNTATQEIYDDVVGAATVYPQVRYVARRFGDTTQPLVLTGTGSLAGSSVSITVAEFDALTEILDGWKEVTLRFATPPTMGTLAPPEPSWTWSSTAETAGNRWEILAACAPAVSGTPGNLYNLVPAADQLYSATYQPPGGAQAELTWMPQGVGSPFVTGSSEDDSCDAFLIFSQDPPTITGVALTSQTQTVTGLGFDCGSLPCCIPSGISYQRITWPVVPGGGMDLPGTAGSYASTPDTAVLDIVGDIDIRADVTLDNYADGVTENVLVSKYNTTGNQRSYRLEIYLDGTISLIWSPDGTGGAALFAASTVAVTTVVSNGRRIAIRATLDVNNGAAGHTAVFYTAPNMDGPWTQLGATVITAGVTSIFNSTAELLAGGSSAGLFDIPNGIIHSVQVYNGIAGTVVANPDFSIQPTGTTTFTDAAGRVWTLFGSATIVHTGISTLGVAGLELQRWDYLQPDFETIMLSTDYTTIGFNDFEARVGVPSVYRIRALNIYNFAGAWSTPVTGAIPTPGVTGGCSDQTGALIFTSNADQTGASNAAYVMQWESDPAETFDLPEAEQVVFQAMYGRDGVVAFHGTERGLEAFSRVLLIHAAAIDPIRLADVKTLRDLAWADLPYICVRDDIADRWFANVQVPTVNARFNRTSYLARVDIRELTRTPYAVDP